MIFEFVPPNGWAAPRNQALACGGSIAHFGRDRRAFSIIYAKGRGRFACRCRRKGAADVLDLFDEYS